MIEDEEGKHLFTRFLRNLKFENVRLTDQFCRHDIEADFEGRTYYFELKKRPIPHTKYNDTIIDEDKYLALKQIQSDKVFVVNIFSDGYLTVVPLMDSKTFIPVMAQKTNNWDRTKVPKKLVSYPNKPNYLWQYDTE